MERTGFKGTSNLKTIYLCYFKRSSFHHTLSLPVFKKRTYTSGYFFFNNNFLRRKIITYYWPSKPLCSYVITGSAMKSKQVILLIDMTRIVVKHVSGMQALKKKIILKVDLQSDYRNVKA